MAAVTLSCLCGRVRVQAPRPDYVHECNCALCAGTGARWGYFRPTDVAVQGATSGYSRTDKADPVAEIRFCPRCGATTHFILKQSAAARFGDGVTGVNMRLADEADLAGIELRFPDGRAWSGEGAFGYVRPARVVGQESDS